MKRGTVTSNPFAELPMPNSITRRERVLTDEEAAAIWRAAGEAPSPMGPSSMLTGQRREEVAGMTWAELSGDLATWTIPATRTKNGIPHLLPLSQPARELLHALPSNRPGDVQGAHQRAKLALVFPGERGTPFSGWSKAKSALDTASGVSGWWLHDLRRTLATGLQRLGVRLEVTEAVLNHLSGSRAGVVGIYQRHDWAEEKRAALDAWSAHLLAAAEGRLPAGKVLPFSRAGAGEV
jgi:integrase